MSTTTRRVLWALPLALAGWIAVLAFVMRFSDGAPAAVVPFPAPSLIAALPEDAAILNLGRLFLTVQNRPGMSEELYRAGAWIVLPAGLKGCLPLRQDARRKLR